MGIFLHLPAILRGVIAPLLLFLAVAGYTMAFIFLLVGTMVIALGDDILARKQGLFTATHAVVRSWSDFITFIVAIIGACVLYPELILENGIFVLILIVGLTVPVIIGFLKYSRFPSYHTWSTRITTIMVGSSAILRLLGGPIWPLEFTIPFYLFARMEEVTIMAIMPQWEFNVPSLRHAIAMERAREREAKAQVEEMLSVVLANIEDGYFETDLRGHLICFNPSFCRRLGYSEEELRGISIRRMMSEEMAKKVGRIAGEVYRTGKPAFAGDWEILSKTGATCYFEASISILRNAQGQPVGFRCIGRDITERKHNEETARTNQEKLHQASKMVALGTLVSSVAHEINNPNNFIRLNAPLLREVWDGVRPILDAYYKENGEFTVAGMEYSVMGEKIPLLISGIEAGSTSILKIIQDLRNYVRNDATSVDNAIDMNQVVESSLALIATMIQKATVNFRVSYQPHIPRIRGNFQRLEQVVINLVQNACQALSSKAQAIRIDIQVDAGNVILTVEDEGGGIPEENMKRLTDPFFTTRQEAGGLGLGLSISRRIIEEHGGSMKFMSEEGKGTRIEVALPIQDA